MDNRTNPALAETRIARNLDGNTGVSGVTEEIVQDVEDMDCAMVSACISFLCGDIDNSTDY